MTNAQYANDFCESVQLYYNDLKKCKPIPRKEEIRLIEEAKNNNIDAKNKILTSNLRFVFDVARKYRGSGVPMADLISEGNIGLTKAIGKFDETKGVKFISYAVWWIKQSILECIKRTRATSEVEIRESDFEPESSDFDITSNTYPDDEQDEYDIPPEKAREKVMKLLSILDDRERDIVEMYYGIGGKKECNLGVLSEKYGLSKERVRQIKKNALRKLRVKIMSEDI